MFCIRAGRGELEREERGGRREIKEKQIIPWAHQSAIPLKKFFLTGQKDLSH